jgi:hypothetical protein
MAKRPRQLVEPVDLPRTAVKKWAASGGVPQARERPRATGRADLALHSENAGCVCCACVHRPAEHRVSARVARGAANDAYMVCAYAVLAATLASTSAATHPVAAAAPRCAAGGERTRRVQRWPCDVGVDVEMRACRRDQGPGNKSAAPGPHTQQKYIKRRRCRAAALLSFPRISHTRSEVMLPEPDILCS